MPVNDELCAALAAASSVRFLCTGNVVRSAFAELYARHLECPLPVDSAATTYQNASLFPETRAALLARGVDERLCDAFRPRRLDRVERVSDPTRVVLGMGRAHLRSYELWLGVREPAWTVLSLLGTDFDLADPVLEGADFGSTFSRLSRAVEAMVRILSTLPSSGRGTLD